MDSGFIWGESRTMVLSDVLVRTYVRVSLCMDLILCLGQGLRIMLDHVCCAALGPWVALRFLALGVPLAPWCPPVPALGPVAWALVSGLVTSCWCRFFGLALGAAISSMPRVNRLSAT